MNNSIAFYSNKKKLTLFLAYTQLMSQVYAINADI